MISLWIVFAIIVIHYIADFCIQTDKEAKGKSKNWKDLLSHTFKYSLVWWIASLIYLAYTFNQFPIQPTSNILPGLYFFLITLICHTITDYFTSRWVKKSFEKQDYHNGFVKIGLDQVLHYIQLFLTFYFLTN